MGFWDAFGDKIGVQILVKNSFLISVLMFVDVNHLIYLITKSGYISITFSGIVILLLYMLMIILYQHYKDEDKRSNFN